MSQIIYEGYKELPMVLSNIGAKKLFLVCGRSYDKMELKDFIEQTDIEIVRFSDFSPNPLYEDICHGVDLFNKDKCDVILAVGGGSAIDVAKCIKLFCRMDHSKNYLDQEMADSGFPLIALPTTAGTGSESTRHAVIYYKGEKQSIFHDSILPDYAILDPSVLKNLPLYHKKCAMLDALCQAIESWWSVNSNDESKTYSRIAVDIICKYWKEYIFDNTESAAKNILYAANYSGRAINITATTAAHAMSYKLTSLYHIAHGHAVAICLPIVWNYMLEHIDDCIDPRGRDYLQSIFNEIEQYINETYFRKLLYEMDIAYPISENRVKDIELLTKSVNPVRLKNTPVALNSEVLHNMYERIVR